jgi:hypothetical protein
MNPIKRPSAISRPRRGLALASVLVVVAAGVLGVTSSAWAGPGTRAASAVAVTYCSGNAPGFTINRDSVQDTNGAIVYFWCNIQDGQIWHEWQLCTGCGYSAPAPLGMPPGVPLLGTPDAVVHPDGRLVVFATGEDRQVWHKWQLCDGCAWSGWSSLGGWLDSNPAAVRKANNTLVVFGLDVARDVNHRWQLCVGCGWSAWTSLGGGIFLKNVFAAEVSPGILRVSALHMGDPPTYLPQYFLYRQQVAPGREFGAWTRMS